MLDLLFHPDIEQELDEAYRWYESQSLGLGDDFLDELDRAFSVIQRMPNTWSIISDNFRRYLLKRWEGKLGQAIGIDT